MARSKAQKKRGRVGKAHAKRRTTTREGRKTGHDPVDPGSAELRGKKLLMTGRHDLPLDPLGALLGRGLIEAREYNAGRDLGDLLEIVGHAVGASVHGMWVKILAGGAPAGQGGGRDLAVDHAWRVLDRLARAIEAPRIANLAFDVAAGRWLDFVLRLVAGDEDAVPRRDDARRLSDLRFALDRIARHWSARERVA